jgi:TetR/AcrR family transcriptional regulator, transcriptional repressor for nem operon
MQHPSTSSRLIIRPSQSLAKPALSMRNRSKNATQTRTDLLAHAGAHAKENGFAASGVDALANAAGFSSGAVYQHFSGKSDFFAAVVSNELQRTTQRFSNIDAHHLPAAEQALRAYLSLAHINHPATGCVLPVLTSEVGRSDESVKQAYQTGLLALHHVLVGITGSQARAWRLLANCVGAVMLARAMPDDVGRQALLDAVLADALTTLLQND